MFVGVGLNFWKKILKSLKTIVNTQENLSAAKEKQVENVRSQEEEAAGFQIRQRHE